MSDKIRLVDMAFYGYHGVLNAERKIGQRIFVDVEITYTRSKRKSDSIRNTIDYKEVYRLVERIQSSKKYRLLESLSEDISKEIMESFPIEEVLVRVRKQNPPIGGLAKFAEVETVRKK